MATNIGIDLGTTSVIVYMEGKGVVLREPSAVAYDKTGKLIAVGSRAYAMSEKAPESIRVVRPLENGVISDFTATRHMVQSFITRICKKAVFKPNVIACVPSMVTKLERRTLLELITAAGAYKACLIEEPLAAAAGAGLRNDRPKGIMVVDIGGGTTDIAVITMGKVAVSKTIQVAGIALDEAIIRQVRRERCYEIGHKTAETIKKRIGSAILRDVELGLTVKGKKIFNGRPESFEMSSTETFLAMKQQLDDIVGAIKAVIEETSPELCGDIIESGIVLTGGGALLKNIDKMIQQKTGIKTRIAADPVNCVALGMGEAFINDGIIDSGDIVYGAV